ncbi:MAG: hypothetical protein ACHQYP_05580 [Nitrospiria bacterium]
MIPVSGFFEYGIMAILGGVGMVGMTIWTLTSNQTNESKEIIMKPQLEPYDSEAFQYKKVA